MHDFGKKVDKGQRRKKVQIFQTVVSTLENGLLYLRTLVLSTHQSCEQSLKGISNLGHAQDSYKVLLKRGPYESLFSECEMQIREPKIDLWDSWYIVVFLDWCSD